jgi:uncharacterized membrane protein
MQKVRILVIASVCLAFVAGAVAGFTASRVEAKWERGSWLQRELNLSPEQAEQMKTIWSEMLSDTRRLHRDLEQALKQQRREALRKLLTDEQFAQYEAVEKDLEEREQTDHEARKAAFDQAVEATKAILDDEQRARYEEMLRKKPGFGPRI